MARKARGENHEGTQETGAVELRRIDGVLTLVGGGMALACDFEDMLPRVKPGRLQQELLVKAAKLKGVDAPFAIDCTAGLGQDSFLLAAAGFRVRMFERDATIAALLEDGLARAAEAPATAAIAARMELAHADSLEYMQALAASGEPAPDVIYLDPMFPARQKSAAVKKKFQLLHVLEAPCDEAEEDALVRAAFDAAPRKVIIKRPAKGALLAGIKPSYSIAGKAVRYDVLTPQSAKL